MIFDSFYSKKYTWMCNLRMCILPHVFGAVFDYHVIEYVCTMQDLDEALLYAAQNGHLEVTQFLVSMGVNIHSNDDLAIQLAASHGHLKVTQYLVSIGANIHSNNDWAFRQAYIWRHNKVAGYLISVGADIHSDPYIASQLYDMGYRGGTRR